MRATGEPSHTARKLRTRRSGQAERLAYERAGRIEILEGALAGRPFVDVTALVTFARQELEEGNARDAAELLAAAEQLCFAALAPTHGDSSSISSALETELKAEFEELIRHAEEKWQNETDRTGRAAVAELYSRTVADAGRAFEQRAYRPALQFARAATALAKVKHARSEIRNAGLLGRLAS